MPQAIAAATERAIATVKTIVILSPSPVERVIEKAAVFLR